MIPIVVKSSWMGTGGAGGLYSGLPVVTLDSFDITASEMVKALEAFASSAEFMQARFRWDKLFARYWISAALVTSKRANAEMRDPATGEVFYERYRYEESPAESPTRSPTGSPSPRLDNSVT